MEATRRRDRGQTTPEGCPQELPPEAPAGCHAGSGGWRTFALTTLPLPGSPPREQVYQRPHKAGASQPARGHLCGGLPCCRPRPGWDCSVRPHPGSAPAVQGGVRPRAGWRMLGPASHSTWTPCTGLSRTGTCTPHPTVGQGESKGTQKENRDFANFLPPGGFLSPLGI